jgi:hypothetical protein
MGALGAMVVLAGLDLLGACMAKEFATRPSARLLVAGLGAFGLLFVVYVRTLSRVQLWTVTVGWVTLLEIGVVVLDRVRYGTHIPSQKLVLASTILVLQVALLLPDNT